MIHGQNLPIKVDHECPSYIFFITPQYVTFAEGQPPQIGKETGAMWRDVADQDDYEAVWRWTFNTYTRKRNAHGIIKDLTTTITSI
jgi:hypothetical protein